MTSDRVLGGVCVLAAGAMGWAARAYVPPFSYEPVGPRAFPMLLAALMALIGLWLVIRPSVHSAAVAQGRVGALVGCIAAVLAYALIFQWAGFAIATALMAVPVGMVFGGRWRATMLGGIGLGLGFYLFFDRALDVVLPTGLLAFLFGGH